MQMDREGRIGMAPTCDQNPLKTQQTYRKSKGNKIDQTPKKSHKTLEASLVWSPFLL
jgi:hypothetical protein